MPCRVTFASAVLVEISGIVVKIDIVQHRVTRAGEFEGCLTLR